MQLFILDEHELKHNLPVQKEAQKSYNMTPRGIQNTLQCNPNHFSSAFSTDFCTALLTVSSYCFARAVHACSGNLDKKKKKKSAGNWEGREKLKQIKHRFFPLY